MRKRPRPSRHIPVRRLVGLAMMAALVIGGVLFLSLRNNDPAAAYAQAQAYEVGGNMRAARVEAMKAVDHDSANEEAWRLLARTQLALGEGQAARGTVERMVRAGVPVGRARHLQAEAELLMGNHQGALAIAAETDGDPLFAANALRVRGRALVELGDTSAAAAAFNAAINTGADDAGLWTDIAHFRLRTGEQAGAIEAVNRAIERAPGSVNALILKGKLVRDQYGLVASLAWFDRALEIDDRNIDALLERAATLGDVGRMQDMLAATRDILALEPGNPNALYLQAVLAARARDFALARRVVSLIDGRLDGVPSMILLEAAIDYQEANYEAAIRHLERLLEIQPVNRVALRLLGAAQLQGGDPRAAIATLTPLADRGDADSYLLTLVGRAWEREGDRARAAPYLLRAANPVGGGVTPLGARPENDAQLALLQRSVRNNGGAAAEIRLIRAYLSLGRGGDALAQANQLRNANPGAPDAHILYGDTLGAVGRFGDAAAAYASAANIRFSEPVALRMVDALDRAGQAEEARRTLLLFREQNPRNLATAMVTAELNMRAGRWQQAAAILEQIRRRVGDRDAAVLANLAWAYHESGSSRRAEALARRAYRLLPMSASTSEIFGWILFDSDANRRAGLELMEKARTLNPDDPGVHWHLAQAYAASGRRIEARLAIQTAMAAPTFVARSEASALLAQL
jgi:tetratricopeptide (TPR) repeat protein